jgi:hypothetical protein
MGEKRGGRWLFLIIIMFVAAVMIAICIYGLHSTSPPNIDKGDYNISSSGPDSHEIIGSPEPLAQDSPDPTMKPTPSPSPRPSAFTIYVEGGKDHRPGETLRFYGMDTYSDVLYLYLSCTKAPIDGGRLDNPQKPVVDRDAATFSRVNVSEDGSWEYYWTVPYGQPALMFDLYNVIAAAEPRDKRHLDEASDWDMVTVKINR